MDKINQKNNQNDEKHIICPRCKQEVYKESIICPFCKFGILAWVEGKIDEYGDTIKDLDKFDMKLRIKR